MHGQRHLLKRTSNILKICQIFLPKISHFVTSHARMERTTRAQHNSPAFAHLFVCRVDRRAPWPVLVYYYYYYHYYYYHFLNPSILTGDSLRPDLLLSVSNDFLYIVELTVGFETNLGNNAKRKKEK